MYHLFAFTTGGISDVATGALGSSDLVNILPAWLTDFGFKTPPPQGFIPLLKWFFFSVPGILTGSLLGAVIMLYYLRQIIRDIKKENREKAEKEKEEKRRRDDERRQKEMNEKLDRIDGKLNGRSDPQ